MLEAVEGSFLYMPFTYGESGAIHEQRCVCQPGLEASRLRTGYNAIIDRFGLYPNRNVTLSRVFTAEEVALVTEPDASF